MTTQVETQAAKANLALSGQVGSIGIFPLDVDKIVTTVNMKVGAYTIAAQPTAPSQLSVSVTVVTGADTMGTITIVGTDIDGAALSEVVTPIGDSIVYTENAFASVTSATGAGWVINTTEDTITIGVASVIAPEGYYICALQIITEAVANTQTALTGFYVADLTDLAALLAGHTYLTKLTAIKLTSGTAIGYLSRI